VPLSHPLRFTDGTLSLREVLRDSIANYHPHQKELEWTALAYGLYLPPAREWTNRFGERESFDGLVEQLLARDLHKSSCCGTHVMYTLTILARVDQQTPILGPEVRDRLWQKLCHAVRVALEAQAADGSWSPDWNKALRSGQTSKPEVARISNL